MGPAVDSSSCRLRSMFVSIGPRLVFSASIAWGSSGAIQPTLVICYSTPWSHAVVLELGLSRLLYETSLSDRIDVIAFKVFSNGLPNTLLKADGNFTTRKLIITVVVRGGSPKVIASRMVPSGITLSPMNPQRGEVVGVKSASLRPVFL